jgi:hypothetical protein
VILGAFFFIRSLLQFVDNDGWAAGLRNGWLLTAFFFVDAYLLGGFVKGPCCIVRFKCLRCLHSM